MTHETSTAFASIVVSSLRRVLTGKTQREPSARGQELTEARR